MAIWYFTNSEDQKYHVDNLPALKLAFKKLGLKGLILAVLLPVSLLSLVIYAII